MQVAILTPAPRGSHSGNRITAERWAAMLRARGDRVRICTERASPCQLLIALHAVRSAKAIREVCARVPRPRIVVVLTGTDYQPRLGSGALASLALADAIVVLNTNARAQLPRLLQKKTQVIVQSAQALPTWVPRGTKDVFRVVVAGHLRAVKDPLRAAMATRRLPSASAIQVLHAGSALDVAMADRARAEMARNPRYRWLGELAPNRTRGLIAGADLFVLSSRAEGGASALSEAIAARVPILASAIPNAIDLLGADHPGLFTAGGTRTLRALLLRGEREPDFLERLRPRARAVRRVSPERERRALGQLVETFGD